MWLNWEMRSDVTRPFDSVESTLEYMVLLEASIAEASGELEEGRKQSKDERSTKAWALAQYKMRQLLFHTQKSRRILNDLRLIRAVMLGGSEDGLIESERQE